MTSRRQIADLQVRPAEPGDLGRLHDINQAAVPGVNSLSLGELERLFSQSAITLVACEAERPMGFVLLMSEGLDYASLNYRWLSERYDRFAYVDRVAVASEGRGMGIGGALYDAAVTHFDGVRPMLVAEVNLAPPNPGSARFHERAGFKRVGERWSDDNLKGVVYFAKPLGSDNS